MKHGLLCTLGLIVLSVVVFATRPAEAQKIGSQQPQQQTGTSGASQASQGQPIGTSATPGTPGASQAQKIGSQQPQQQTGTSGASQAQQGQSQSPQQQMGTSGASQASQVQKGAPVTPARVPFQVALEIALPNGTGGQNGFVPVPQGKRLVIEYASAEAFMPRGQKCLFSILTQLRGATVQTRHYLNSIPMGGFGAPDYFQAGQIVKLYADPGTTVMLRGDRDIAIGDAKVRFSISGYLVDLQ